MSKRIIHQGDGLAWLRENGVVAGASFVTSLPDFSELPAIGFDGWREWFVEAARLVMASCPDDGVAIFYQRDAKREGTWVDKGYLCMKAAELEGSSLLWHKIVCRVPPGGVTFGKPAYSHLLCFSRGVRLELEKSRADVILRSGKVDWARGMGTDICELVLDFVGTQVGSRVIVDPFCGHGLVLACAEKRGFEAVGVELSRKRAEKARAIEWRPG